MRIFELIRYWWDGVWSCVQSLHYNVCILYLCQCANYSLNHWSCVGLCVCTWVYLCVKQKFNAVCRLVKNVTRLTRMWTDVTYSVSRHVTHLSVMPLCHKLNNLSRSTLQSHYYRYNLRSQAGGLGWPSLMSPGTELDMILLVKSLSAQAWL